MKTWYDLDPEVIRECQMLREMKQPPAAKKTFRGQALREMAKRVNLEEKVKCLKQDNSKLMARLEELDSALQTLLEMQARRDNGNMPKLSEWTVVHDEARKLIRH
jgi:cell fate (sporulation/competence/biofilm development) regulator YlbF (YheA/YmcA/DUF963 family)